MPQVLVLCPLDEFEPRHENRLQPTAALHLLGRQALTPASVPCFGQICKRALARLKPVEPADEGIPERRRESAARPPCIEQPRPVVVAEDQCVERRVADGVAADL
jgi:hypothetical protein